MTDECKDCSRLRRAREAAAQQLQALHLENESLARQVNELTEALQKHTSERPARDREPDVESTLGGPPAHTPAAQVSTVDVWADGDNVAPTRVLLRESLGAFGKQLAVAVVSPITLPTTGPTCYLIGSSADKHIRAFASFDAASGAATEGSVGVSSMLASVACATPALSLAILPHTPFVPGPEQLVYFVSGHMDGAVVLWELRVLIASAPTTVPVLRMRVVGEHPSAHTKLVTRLSCDPFQGDGSLLFSAGTDGSLVIWTAVFTLDDSGNSARLCQLQRLAFPAPVCALAWGPPAVATTLGGGESALRSVALSVEGAPYLYYVTLLAVSEAGVQALTALQLNRVPLSEDGIGTDLLHSAPAESVQISASTRLPLWRRDLARCSDADTGASIASPAGLCDEPTVVPVHHPDAASVHLPISGVMDVLPVGFSVVDMACASSRGPDAAAGSPWGTQQLLAAATSSGLVLVYGWGSNRVLRRFAGHLRFTSPTYSGGSSAGISTGALRVQWYPSSAPPQYLLASTDAGNDVAVFGLASQRVLTLLPDASAGGGSRTTLRTMEVVPARTVHEGDMLLTLDNSSNVTLRCAGLLT
jgi:hypothetical protein